MAWVAVGTMVVGTVVGSMQQREKEKALAKQNQAAAEMTRYSAYSKGGETGKLDANPNGMAGAAFGGAMSGLAQGQGIKQSMSAAPEAPPSASGGMSAGGNASSPWSGMKDQFAQNNQGFQNYQPRMNRS